MKVAILGAGAMGSALTVPPSENGHEVVLWGTEFDEKSIKSIRDTGIHPALGARLPKINTTFDMMEAVKGASIVVIAVSSEGFKNIATEASKVLPKDAIFLTVTKGLAEKEGMVETLSDFYDSFGLHNPYVAIGGPSLAKEVALGNPTRVVFASKDEKAAETCTKAFKTKNYFVEKSTDVRGVELLSALKNVYAIPLGAILGIEKKTGNVDMMKNLWSAVFTAAVEEMASIVEVFGGKKETAYGLAGLGDLEVSVRGGRNAKFGQYLGEGMSIKEAEAKIGSTVEGYGTTKLVYGFVSSNKSGKLNTPLLKATYEMLYKDRPAESLLEILGQ